jgi:hypothetical protein
VCVCVSLLSIDIHQMQLRWLVNCWSMCSFDPPQFLRGFLERLYQDDASAVSWVLQFYQTLPVLNSRFRSRGRLLIGCSNPVSRRRSLSPSSFLPETSSSSTSPPVPAHQPPSPPCSPPALSLRLLVPVPATTLLLPPLPRLRRA